MDAADTARFAREWVAAWNARDVDAVLSHYGDDVVFHSPMIARVMGDARRSVRGKAELKRYWRTALALIPDLHFEVERVLTGSDALTLLYRNQRGQAVAESFVFDEAGRVTLSIAAYE